MPLEVYINTDLTKLLVYRVRMKKLRPSVVQSSAYLSGVAVGYVCTNGKVCYLVSNLINLFPRGVNPSAREVECFPWEFLY